MDSRGKILAASALGLAYMEARRRLLDDAERRAVRIGPKWLGVLAWQFLHGWSRLMGVRLASEKGEGLDLIDPARRYLIVWHPHGFIAWSALFIVSRMAVIGHPHGREWFAMVAPALFKIPIFSEALMLVNGRKVDKKVVENLLEKGQSIAIQPGGVKEQMASRHDQEQAVFPQNLGFIRMAIKHGMDLLPVYIFNENQLYRKVDGFEGATSFIHRTTGMVLPASTAKFGLPMAGLMPKSNDIHVRWGAPIAVGDADPEPSDERVEALFQQYLVELRKIFKRYASECLPPDVAAKGLLIIRLDGKPVPAEDEESPSAAATVGSSTPSTRSQGANVPPANPADPAPYNFVAASSAMRAPVSRL